MTTDTPPPPRRNWQINRWLVVFLVATLSYGTWRATTFRAALAQAKTLGWDVEYTDPGKVIRANWMAAFKKETWLDGVTEVKIPTSKGFEQHLDVIHRLNPLALIINDAATLHDLSALKRLNRLENLGIYGCTGLTNVDAFNNLPRLTDVTLDRCTGLTNIEAIKNLTALQRLFLTDCAGLTNADFLADLRALQWVTLEGGTGLTNVDAVKNLTDLQWVVLTGCTGLKNVDALKNLTALYGVCLNGCTGVTNVDFLKNLPRMREVFLSGCTGLAKDSVGALKTFLPNTMIVTP